MGDYDIDGSWNPQLASPVLPTAQEIDDCQYSDAQVREMHQRLAEMNTACEEEYKRHMAADDAYKKSLKRITQLEQQLAEQRQLAQFYRAALQEIRDRTPANQPYEWPHHHWYLGVASKAINGASKILQGGEKDE